MPALIGHLRSRNRQITAGRLLSRSGPLESMSLRQSTLYLDFALETRRTFPGLLELMTPCSGRIHPVEGISLGMTFLMYSLSRSHEIFQFVGVNLKSCSHLSDLIVFRKISNAWRSPFDNVNSGEVPYDSFLQVTTRTSERSASSGDSVSWVEEARKTFLPIMSAVGPTMVHPRTVAIARGAVSGPLITEVVVIRSMMSVPRNET